jgi:hypothetical protein
MSFIKCCRPSVVFEYSADEDSKPEVDGGTVVGAGCAFRDTDLVQEAKHKTAQARKSRANPRYDIDVQPFRRVLFWNA